MQDIASRPTVGALQFETPRRIDMRIFRRLAAPLAIILLWQIGSAAGIIPANKLAAPSAILHAAWELTVSGDLFRHLAVSLTRVTVGLAAGVGIGVALALIVGLSQLGDDSIDPVMQMLRTLPYLGMTPLLILWFGIGELPKIALVAFASMFPVYMTLLGGIRSVDPKLIEAARIFGLQRWDIVRHVILPGSLAPALVGLRYSLGAAGRRRSNQRRPRYRLSHHGRARLSAHRRHHRRPPRLRAVGIADGYHRARGRAARAGMAPRAAAEQPVTASGVTVNGLELGFGTTAVLRGLDFTIAPGEFVALLGRSGSGKTTLLRVLAGLERPQAGHVSVPEPRAVVFQEPRLLPWKPVWENVVIGLGGNTRRARADAALREVRLDHRADNWPLTLSGGEAQRAGLARALVREPKLLLLDEPFASVDALTRLRMHELVIDLWRVHGPSILLVTHDVDEALLLADRAVVLDGGRLIAEIRLDHPRPRDPASGAFAAQRRTLLQLLGVSTADPRPPQSISFALPTETR
jgi:sulfonate transport system ATP-binding protein